MSESTRLILFFLTVAFILWGISQYENWYGGNVLAGRMCQRKEIVISNFKRVLALTSTKGTDISGRRELMIAAKLIYLVPQHSNESQPQYILRIREFLSNFCLNRR